MNKREYIKANKDWFDAILKELSTDGFSDSDQSDFWDEMTNLQKARILR